MKNTFNTLKHIAAAAAAVTVLGLTAVKAQAVEMIVTSEIPLAVNPSPYIVQLIDELKKRTNGEVQGKYFHASTLFNDKDAIAALGTGSVHMVLPVTSRLEQLDARFGVASLPFVLNSGKLSNQCFSNAYAKLLSEYLEPKGVKVMGLLKTADLIFLMKNRDIQKVEDLKGQKIRVISGGVILDAMKSIGASPVTMAASELSTALSQGVIDGMMTSPAGWADVVGPQAKFAALFPGMALATSAVTVDKKWFDALSPQSRDVVQKTVDEIVARQWKEAAARDEALIKRMQDQGGTYRVMPAAEVAKLKTPMVAASANFRKQHAQAIAKVEALEKSCNVQ